MDKEIEIRKVTPGDIKALQQIGKQTFFETFSESNTEENIKRYLEEGFSMGKLAEELANEQSDFYFALQDKEVIGYLKLNAGESQTEAQDNESLEIERIYVLKQYHGQKIGQLLYDKALQIASERKSKYIWLGVWEKNPRAISFYKKNGFVECDKHIFVLGDDQQTDILMKKML